MRQSHSELAWPIELRRLSNAALNAYKRDLGRKEVTTVNYDKPEVAVLGDAMSVIQGSKNDITDPPDNVTGPSLFEMED